jgi:putative tryptophan/tyrosine transport system substrate-binding protein
MQLDQLKRREFITVIGGMAAAWPLVAGAQQPAMPVVGWLSSASPNGSSNFTAAFRAGLAETGYVEGQNVTIEYRWAENHNDRLTSLVVDLVNKRVAVIVASAIRATLAAKSATTQIPIVFATANDPVQFGLVASFNRPGGNITGVAYLTAELGEKRLAILHDLIPRANVFGVIVNPNNANAESNVKNLQGAALAIGAQSVIANAATEDDFDAAISMLVRQRVQAALVLNDPLFTDRRDRLVSLVTRHEIPAIYPLREFVDAGGLMSYAASVADAHRQAGVYAGRILKGAKPADLPVVQPTKFELVINLKTAKALGLQIPDKLLALADEVME